MRNVINLNQDWKFIQQDAGLPESLPASCPIPGMPLTDRMEMVPMTEENTGMPRLLRRQNSLCREERYLWRSWRQDSRPPYM